MKPNLCPDMPFYPADWLSSTAISLMSPAEEGAFIHLLSHAWGTEDCTLPDDDTELAILSRLGSDWNTESGRKIRKEFEKDPNSPSRIFNPKQREVRRQQDERRKQASRKGVSGANARWEKKSKTEARELVEQCPGNAQASAEHMPQDASSHVSHLTSHMLRESDHNIPRPSLEEVTRFGVEIGLPDWKATDWFNEMQGGGWVDHYKREIVDWRSVLRRVHSKWERDGKPDGTQVPVICANNRKPQSKASMGRHEFTGAINLAKP